MPLPLFCTKSQEGKPRRTVSRNSSRESSKMDLPIMAMTARNFQSDHESPSLQMSFESAMLQSSLDMEDIMRRFEAVIGIDGDGSHKTPPRASEAVLSRLPRARILRPHKKLFEHDNSTCGVCCERLMDGVALTRLPCGHMYHINCSTSWLSKTCTCPECRYEVETDDVLFEKTRVTRMKDRKTVSCNCHPSGMHNCFFADPSKSLLNQLDTCVEVNATQPVGGDSGAESDECSLSDGSSCEPSDPSDADRYFY